MNVKKKTVVELQWRLATHSQISGGIHSSTAKRVAMLGMRDRDTHDGAPISTLLISTFCTPQPAGLIVDEYEPWDSSSGRWVEVPEDETAIHPRWV